VSQSTLQRLAQERLQELYDHPPEGRRKSWQVVQDQTGINRGQAWKIRYGKQKASRKILRKLGVQNSRKPRIPWKKKYQLLRKFISQRRAH